MTSPRELADWTIYSALNRRARGAPNELPRARLRRPTAELHAVTRAETLHRLTPDAGSVIARRLAAMTAGRTALRGNPLNVLDVEHIVGVLPLPAYLHRPPDVLHAERAIFTDWPDWDWLPYAEKAFDAVVLGTHLQASPLLGWHLAEFARVLRIGGVILAACERDEQRAVWYSVDDVLYHARLAGYDARVLRECGPRLRRFGIPIPFARKRAAPVLQLTRTNESTLIPRPHLMAPTAMG